MVDANVSDEGGTTLARVVRDNLSLPLTDGDIKGILAEVRANHARLEGCALHDFQPIEPGKFGTKYSCPHCGGVVDGINASWYKSGLAHGYKRGVERGLE